MTNNMDELLNQLAAEYIQKKEAQAKSKTPPPAKRSSKKSTSSASMHKVFSILVADENLIVLAGHINYFNCHRVF